MNGNLQQNDSELISALSALLFPIGKLMLQQGLGVGELIRAAKFAYVRAAIADVLPLGSRVNASRLSVTTGLTRKEVSMLMSQFDGQTGGRSKRSNDQRAQRVLRGWQADPRFFDNKGLPAVLPMRGRRRSFQLLVKLYGGDVTPKSVLKELERMRAVKSTPVGELRLRSRRGKEKSIQKIEELARLFSDFASTVSERDAKQESSPFFGFRESMVFSPNQAARFHRTFSNRAVVLLDGVEQWLRSQKPVRHTAQTDASERFRVGIGVYTSQQSVIKSRETEALPRGKPTKKRRSPDMRASHPTRRLTS